MKKQLVINSLEESISMGCSAHAEIDLKRKASESAQIFDGQKRIILENSRTANDKILSLVIVIQSFAFYYIFA